MNEIAIRHFVEMTEKYIRQNKNSMDQSDLNQVTELYEDLSAELSRQQLFDELYH
jgi:hypothetical protein